MTLNPLALAVWLFGSVVGYLIGGTLDAALIGLAIGLGLTIIGSLL